MINITVPVTLADGTVVQVVADAIADPQAIRDAFLLAPTTSLTPAAGSIDDKLANTATQTDVNAARDTIATLINAGVTLTTTQVSAIATAVEASLLNENDGQQIINAIVSAIGNQNIDEVALVAAIRADLERVGGAIKSIPTNPLLKPDFDARLPETRAAKLDRDLAERSDIQSAGKLTATAGVTELYFAPQGYTFITEEQ